MITNNEYWSQRAKDEQQRSPGNLLTDVRYAMQQLRRSMFTLLPLAAALDCCQRALDALERVEAKLDDPGNAAASDAFLAQPPDPYDDLAASGGIVDTP